MKPLATTSKPCKNGALLESGTKTQKKQDLCDMHVCLHIQILSKALLYRLVRLVITPP